MVSIGSIFSVLVVGAVIAGGVALYANRNKIGGAFTRGIETNLTNPLGNYFDSLFQGSSTTAEDASTTTSQAVNPLSILDPFPVATAQTPTAATAIDATYAQSLTDKYLPRAQASAKTAIAAVNVSDRAKLLTQADLLAANSPTPELTQSFSIVDQIRKSVSNPEDPKQNPNLNKFYSLFTLANKPFDGGKVIPLSQAAVQSFAKSGVIAREVYL